MAKKKIEDKKVSINKFEKFISPIVPFSLAFDEETSILIKPRLNFVESVSFVRSVVDGCIDEIDGTVDYNTKDFLIRVAFFDLFTNVRLPEDYEKKYEFVYGVEIDGEDLYERIINHKDFKKDLYENHILAINNQVKFEVSKMQNQFKVETQEFISKIESEAEQVMKIVSSFTDVFKNIEPTQMGKILAKIPEMENFSEKNFASAILEIQNEEKGEVDAGI